MNNRQLTHAVAYFRTSSLTNVGEGKDSERRQRDAVTSYAKRAGYKIVEEFFDEGVKGADPVHERPGFAALLKRVASNGAKTIIVETANRFSRDLSVQEAGWRMLKDAGITLIAADSPDAFVDDTPTAVMVRQILGAVSQFEKAATVAKLKRARDEKKSRDGKCGGRKSYKERSPEAVALAKKLERYPTNGRKRSLREIARELRLAGHITPAGKEYAAAAIAEMLKPRDRRVGTSNER